MPPVNVLLTGLPSISTLCLRVGDIDKPLAQSSLTAAVTAATGLPSPSFYLRHAGALLSPGAFVTNPGQHTIFVQLFIRRALPGGKGGFGANLKGSSATKATTNFDACRDLHGRRLKHVRDEAALREYLRTRGPPTSRNETAKKRPRSPDLQHEEPITKVDTEELDHAIDAVNRDVEDAVAAGLRAAAAKRKKRRSKKLVTAAASAGVLGRADVANVPASDSADVHADPFPNGKEVALPGK